MTTVSTSRRQGVSASAAIKVPCACATTANITLSGEQTIDGVTTSGSRVLAKDQTTASENGIWDSSSSAWQRAPDFDGTYDAVTGTLIRVNGGTVNGNSFFSLTTTGTITIGSTSLTFANDVTELTGVSAFMQTVLDDADAATARATLAAAGTGANNTMSGTNTHSGTNTFSNTVTISGAVINEAKGASVASATSPNIWTTTGGTVHITGTTNITGFAAAPQAGAVRRLIFDGAVLLSDGANLVVPGGDYTTSADDIVFVIADTTTKFYIVIFKADGSQTAGYATQAQMEAASVNTVAVTPSVVKYHPGVAKVLCRFDGTGTPTIGASQNVSYITDNGTGDYTLNFTTALESANFILSGNAGSTSNNAYYVSGPVSSTAGTTSARIAVVDSAGVYTDVKHISVVIYGDFA